MGNAIPQEFWRLAFELLIDAGKGEQQSKLSAVSRAKCIDVFRSALASLFPVGKTMVEIHELKLLPGAENSQRV